jgi:hypothetical protein
MAVVPPDMMQPLSSDSGRIQTEIRRVVGDGLLAVYRQGAKREELIDTKPRKQNSSRAGDGILAKHRAFDATGSRSLDEKDGIALEVVKGSKRLRLKPWSRFDSPSSFGGFRNGRIPSCFPLDFEK